MKHILAVWRDVVVSIGYSFLVFDFDLILIDQIRFFMFC